MFVSGPTGMDEGLLNDLLECSVCLERLDTSSRVLPCQHTFCLKCLKVISSIINIHQATETRRHDLSRMTSEAISRNLIERM